MRVGGLFRARYAGGALCSLLALAACGHKPRVAVAPPPPVVVAPPPALPSGATPGMRIPARLADGSYPTPNRALSPQAALWHLRAGLNVAALSCPDAQGEAIVAAYNAWLTRAKIVLAAAETAQAGEYRASGGADWRDTYDDAMTRLYNYYSQTPARPALCAAATAILTDLAMVAPDALPTSAIAMVAAIDRPFTDFYRAYDAWRAGTVQVTQPGLPMPVIATAARGPVSQSWMAMAPGFQPATPRPPMQPAVPAPAPAPVLPRLTVDPRIFTMP